MAGVSAASRERVRLSKRRTVECAWAALMLAGCETSGRQPTDTRAVTVVPSPTVTRLVAPEGFASVNGARVYYEVRGPTTGKPLVLIHSAFTDHRMWDPQVAAFAERYRVIRYDARGYGRSELPNTSYSNQADLRSLLQQLGVERTAVVGVSFGGGVALDFALDFPDMVAALVPVGSALNGYTGPRDPLLDEWAAAWQATRETGDRAPAADAFMKVWVDGTGRADDTVRAKVRVMVDEYRFGHLAKSAPSAAAGNTYARAGSIKVPTLVVVGERDVPYMIGAMEALASRVPGAQHAIIAGAAHLANLDQPELFNRLVLDFLARVPS